MGIGYEHDVQREWGRRTEWIGTGMDCCECEPRRRDCGDDDIGDNIHRTHTEQCDIIELGWDRGGKCDCDWGYGDGKQGRLQYWGADRREWE